MGNGRTGGRHQQTVLNLINNKDYVDSNNKRKNTYPARLVERWFRIDYQMHVMAKGRELLHTYDALLAEETDAADRQKLMQQANNAIAEMLKKETQDTLDKVLFELSSQMKNAYSRSDA